MFCRKCGKQLPDTAAFCAGCGTPCAHPVQTPGFEHQEPVKPDVELEIPVIPQEEVAEQPVDQPVEETMEAPVEEPAEQPVEETVEAPTEETAEAPAEEPAEQPVEETVEAPAQWPQEQVPVAPFPVAEPAEIKKPAPKKKHKERPHFAVRMLMQFLSFVLCLVLFASVIATVAVADLRQMTSADGIKRVLDAFLGLSTSAEYVAPPKAPGGQTEFGAVTLSDYEFDIDDIPDDILSGGNSEENVSALVDWIYDELVEGAGKDVKFTREEFQTFVEESTVTEFVSEKLAGYAEDFINGTENTEITTEEIMDLLEENKKELKNELNVELTDKVKSDIKKQVDKVVVEQDINNTIRETVNSTVEEALQEIVGMDLETVRSILKLVTSDLVFVAAIVLCVLLMGLLFLVNFYNLGAGLTWSASAGLLASIILAVPLLAVQYASEWAVELVPELGKMMGLINSFMASLAPIHYGVLIGFAVLLVLSIVWRIVASSLRNRASKAV